MMRHRRTRRKEVSASLASVVVRCQPQDGQSTTLLTRSLEAIEAWLWADFCSRPFFGIFHLISIINSERPLERFGLTRPSNRDYCCPE